LDHLGWQPARAAIGAGPAGVVLRPLHQLAARRAAGEALGGTHRLALDLGDHLLDRPARRGLHDEEVQHHDAEQRRHDEQQPAQEIGKH
jgi:hypothetical protein